MLTKTCPACRTVNQASFPACIRCGSRLDAAPMPPQEGPETGHISAEMPPAPGLDEKGRPKEFRLGLVVMAVVLALLVGGVAFLVSLRGRGFPETLGGYVRIESDEEAAIEDLLKQAAEPLGLSVDVAFYGSGNRPTLLVMIIDGAPEGQRGMPETVGEVLSGPGSGLSIDPSNMVLQTRDGVDYFCISGGAIPTGTPQPGAACIFDGEVDGMLYVLETSNSVSAFRLTEEFYGAYA